MTVQGTRKKQFSELLPGDELGAISNPPAEPPAPQFHPRGEISTWTTIAIRAHTTTRQTHKSRDVLVHRDTSTAREASKDSTVSNSLLVARRPCSCGPFRRLNPQGCRHFSVYEAGRLSAPFEALVAGVFRPCTLDARAGLTAAQAQEERRSEPTDFSTSSRKFPRRASADSAVLRSTISIELATTFPRWRTDLFQASPARAPPGARPRPPRFPAAHACSFEVAFNGRACFTLRDCPGEHTDPSPTAHCLLTSQFERGSTERGEF
jgi:hypothetical protein